MAENRKGECALDYCSEHPTMIEKVTRLETAMQAVQEVLKESSNNFKEMRRELGESMAEIRKDITNGILKRYPGHIVLIITFLTSLCTGLLVAYLHRL